MAERVITVGPGQSIEDIALQEYGSIDGVTLLLSDNLAAFPNGYSTDLMPGTELTVRDVPLDAAMCDAMLRLRVVPSTNSTAGFDTDAGADYNNDHNDDHQTN